MKPDCRNDCPPATAFPRKICNRPGLSRIDYRIGAFADFRDELLRDLNRDPTLAAWTHRGPDDPGIALLEGASILADILTFYQDLYANQAYLRTATWRENIGELVRLLGYRLSPGLGGKATFAFEVKGDDPVVVPRGFAVKAQLDGLDEPATFETKAEATAYPHLSRFSLYRPRLSARSITAGADNNKLEVEAVDGESDADSIAALEVEPGDRIMLVPSDVDKKPYIGQRKAEILIITEVETILDRRVITFEGSLTEDRDKTVTAYRLGRSFRHFGHNAPAMTTTIDGTTVKQTPTEWDRDIWRDHEPPTTSPGSDYYSALKENEMPLDEEVDDLAAGGFLICQGSVIFSGDPIAFTVRKKIQSVRADSPTWGNLAGPSTMVVLDSQLIAGDDKSGTSDIRQMRFHEVKGPELTLRAPTKWKDGDLDKTLAFFGTYDEALALAGRSLLLEAKDGRTGTVAVTNKTSHFSLTKRDKIQSWMWPLTLGRKDQEALLLEEFDEEEPTVTVYGNLVDATQGKTEREATLGNGDGRQTFQTFKLPKAPLTYHNSAGETPPEVPELQLYVNDRLWKRVASFFDHKPDEEIYIARQDAKGDSWVQFGDGRTGARLPSGIDNVVARYRTGTGAYGALKEDTNVQPAGRLDRLDKIQLPEGSSGSAKPETGANAKEAAPGKTQSLGRLVGLQDFETETLAIPGVSRATAAWQLEDNVPAVVLTVLMETGRADEVDDEVQKILNGYNRCRGPQRFPVLARPGRRLFIYVAIKVAFKPSFRQELVRREIQEALGVVGAEGSGIDASAGLLALGQRRFGQQEYRTRIEAAVQNVVGVEWTRVTALSALSEADDPSTLRPTSPADAPASLIGCGSQQILSLYHAHLHISAVPAEPAEEC